MTKESFIQTGNFSIFKRKLYNQEYWNKHDCESFDLSLPRVKFNNNGYKYLFIVSYVPESDINSKELMGNNEGLVLQNIINYMTNINKEYKNNIKEIAIINYHCFRINKLSETLKHKATYSFYNRLKRMIIDYNPDFIVFFGKDGLEHFKIKEYFDYKFDIGRIKNIVINKKRYKFIATLPIDVIGTTNKKIYNSGPNLIGVVIDNLKNVFNGKNYYDITKEVNEVERIYVDNIDKFNKFYKLLLKSEIISVDTEGTSLNRLANKLLTLQVYLNYNNKCYFLPIYHKQTPFKTKELEYIKEKLKYYFELCNSKYIVFQNAKFDVIQLRVQLNIIYFNHRLYDTMAGEYSLDENVKFLFDKEIKKYLKADFAPFSLEYMERKYGYRRPTDLAVNKENRSEIANLNLMDAFEYACLDAITIYYIHLCQIKEAKRRGKYYRLFLKSICEQISDMIHVFADMEINGTPIDKKYLIYLKTKNSKMNLLIDEIKNKFKENINVQYANKLLLKEEGVPENTLFGGTKWIFDIDNVKSQQALFFNILELDPLKERKDGKGGVVDKSFQNYYSDIEEVNMYSNYKKITKLRDTYRDGTWRIIQKSPDYAIDNRIRSDYVYIIIITGRAGANKPNLQQIPSHGPLAKLIKRMFIADPDYILLEVDYSAHEVRNWVNVSLDKMFANIFRQGMKARQRLRSVVSKSLDIIKKLKKEIEENGDIHKLNYKFFYGRLPKDKNERQSIKNVVFGVIYGKSAPSLAEDIYSGKQRKMDIKRIKELKKELKSVNKEIKKLAA